MPRDGGWLVVALCALAGCLGYPPNRPVEITGIRGQEVTLEPEVTGTLTGITWKKSEDIVAEWDEPDWFASHLKGRAKLNRSTGSLTLEKLEKNDAGEYKAEASVGTPVEFTFFSVRILEPPSPPYLNCTAVDDRIQVRCELDPQDVAQKITPTYKWRYQNSNKEIPGNTSQPVIWLKMDVDLSENITCVISISNANASASIPLKSCIPTGAAPQRRHRNLLVVLFVVVPFLVAFFFYVRKKGVFNIRRKSGDCEGEIGADGTPSEGQRLHEEHSGNLEENSREDGIGANGTPSEGQHLHEEHSGNLEENCREGGAGADGTPSGGQHLDEKHSGNLEENSREGPSDPGT